jgi:hypothetical protein
LETKILTHSNESAMEKGGAEPLACSSLAQTWEAEMETGKGKEKEKEKSLLAECHKIKKQVPVEVRIGRYLLVDRLRYSIVCDILVFGESRHTWLDSEPYWSQTTASSPLVAAKVKAENC